MDKKQGFMGFFGQVITIYGIVILILNIFCMIFGEGAREISSIFSLGSSGISVGVSMQFFVMSVIMAAFRLIFLTDCIIKRGSVVLRSILMFASVFALAVIFIILFGWFSVNNAMAWVMFILSFGVSGTVSTLTTARREKQENEMLNVALNKIKENL